VQSKKPKHQQDPETEDTHKQPLTLTGKLRGKLAKQHDEKSFYAKFGDKPCVCTPIEKSKRSKN